MSDSVKFIFKTLFKVPIIIFTSFLVLNILFFFLTYFKMLGFSYVIMQTAVENNYIPDAEMNVLLQYAQSMQSQHQNNTGIVIDSSGTTIVGPGTAPGKFAKLKSDGNREDVNGMNRQQYGATVTVGCSTQYTLVWPLDHVDTFKEGRIIGNTNNHITLADGGTLTNLSDDELTNAQNAKKAHINIKITYTVPGLKYYPDMNNY